MTIDCDRAAEIFAAATARSLKSRCAGGASPLRSRPTAFLTNGANFGLSSKWKATPSTPQPHHFMCLTADAGLCVIAGLSVLGVVVMRPLFSNRSVPGNDLCAGRDEPIR